MVAETAFKEIASEELILKMLKTSAHAPSKALTAAVNLGLQDIAAHLIKEGAKVDKKLYKLAKSKNLEPLSTALCAELLCQKEAEKLSKTKDSARTFHILGMTVSL